MEEPPLAVSTFIVCCRGHLGGMVVLGGGGEGQQPRPADGFHDGSSRICCDALCVCSTFTIMMEGAPHALESTLISFLFWMCC